MKKLVIIMAGLIALTGCGTAAKNASAGASATPLTTGTTQAAPETSPSGDIPDNQAFVVFSPGSGPYSVKIPEGWAKTEAGGVTSFTDKLNAISLQSMPAALAPTTVSVSSQELLDVSQGVGYKAGAVTTVSTNVGKVVKATYAISSSPNPVTGKVVQDDVERYSFWKNGTEVVVTLTSPQGADNVDPWRTVIDSFSWR